MSEHDQFSVSEDYQIKILANMLHKPDFCDISGDALKNEDFANKALQWFFDKLTKTEKHLSATLLKEEFITAAEDPKGGIRPDELDKFVGVFNSLSVRPTPVEEQHIEENLSRFVRTQATKRAILESADLMEAGQWDEIVEKVTEATQAGMDITDRGQDYFTDFESRLDRRMNAEVRRKLATGIPELDEILYGGLKTKQLALIAGGTGRGKSVFLLWLARVAVLLGKSVVYYTLELSEEDVAERFDAMFSHIKINELKTHNAEVFNSLSTYSSQFGTRLIVKEYPPDEATVHTLKAHMRQLSAAGVVPDLVIVDYLDLLKPHRTYNSQTEELDAITKALRGLAVSQGTRVWTASQLNRGGIAMENPDETAIAGALSKLFTADVSIFMAQTKDEREDQYMRLSIVKNRNGPTGRSIKITTDYAYMTFYRSELAGEDDDTGTP